MRSAIKYFAGITYKPLLEKYLSKTRRYTYKGIDLVIPPEVFHPGFFFSTKLLLKYIEPFPLNTKTFLELGAGSGLISIFAARMNAIVTATDINSAAVEFLKKNAKANNVQVNIICSDLFKNIPPNPFDYIAINPPYYKKQPSTLRDYAWYCGEHGEYFENLFASLSKYSHTQSIILMILCDGCDMQMIHSIAQRNNFHLNCVYSKQNIIEKNFIFKIEIEDTRNKT